MNKTKRTRRPDRLLHPSVTPEELRCDMAVAAFDREARKMDERWGIDRLPELVSPETADRYAQALGQMNEAMNAQNVELIQHKASVCIRGMGVMDAEAVAAGHQPAQGEFWELTVGDFKVGILKDDREWQAAKAKRPDLRFFTRREVALALEHFTKNYPVMAAKEAFPGSEAIKITDKSINDPIPF